MTRKGTARKRASKRAHSVDLARDPFEVSGSGESRRFLKHLDRRLLRFSNQIDALEERANRLSYDDDADVILAVESLHRETLLLRAEIREHLAGGRRSPLEMTDHAEESWEQLRETFEELKETLTLEGPSSRPAVARIGLEEEDVEGEWAWDEGDWAEDGNEDEVSGVHRPRLGPKR